MESEKPLDDSTSQKEEPLNQGKILSIVSLSKRILENDTRNYWPFSLKWGYLNYLKPLSKN